MTKLIVVGAAGLDWPEFDATIRAGALPRLARLRRAGAAAPLAGAPFGDALVSWATLASGVEPEVHRLWRAQELWAGGLRPTGRASWRFAPVWARLAAARISTGGVGWPASSPGAGWAVMFVDETFAEPTGARPEDWAMPLNCAPRRARDALAARRVHPTQITTAMMQGFAPDIAEIDQTHRTPLPALAVALARASTVQAGAVWLISESAPDAAFVHHGFYGEVRTVCESQPSDRRYARAGEAALRFVDGLIGRLAEVAGSARLIVVSPGWRGLPGVWLDSSGSSSLARTGALDLAPTALAHFGYADERLPGRARAHSPAATPLCVAPNVEIPPPDPADADLVAAAAQAGFRLPTFPMQIWQAQGLAELAFFAVRRAPEAAESTTAEALRLDAENLLALRTRALALFALERPDELPALADALERGAPQRGWAALARGAFHALRREPNAAARWLRAGETDPDPDVRLAVAAGWLVLNLPVDAERVFHSVLAIDPRNISAEVGVGMTSIARRDYLAAEAALARAAERDPTHTTTFDLLAQVYTAVGRKREADTARTRARAQ